MNCTGPRRRLEEKLVEAFERLQLARTQYERLPTSYNGIALVAIESEVHDIRELLQEIGSASNNATPEKQGIEQRAARRQAVVMPILRDKGWSRGHLVTGAGVGKNTVYKYLDGTRATITDKNRNAIADVLGLPPEQLPD